MSNQAYSQNSSESLKNTALAKLLHRASTILNQEWSISCNEIIGCLYQDKDGVLVGTHSGWIKRFDGLGNLQSEFLALEGEDITVIAFWESAFKDGPEIIMGTNRGSVCAFRNDGERLWYANVSKWVGGLFLSQERGDEEGMEIIVGTHDGTLFFLDRLGNAMDSFHTSHTVLTAATHDGEASQELYFIGTRDGYIIALNRSGKELWNKRTDGWVYRLHQFRDTDDKNILLTGMQNGDLIAWDQNGGRLWKRSLGYWVSGLAVGDVNGDGVKEIVATTRNGSIYILNQNGQTIWRWDINEMAVDVICLHNQDELTRIVLVTEESNLKCYSFTDLDNGLLQEIDNLVQEQGDLAGLPESEFSILKSLGFVVGPIKEITYDKTLNAIQNDVLLDGMDASALLAQIDRSPMILVWSHQVPAKIDTITWFLDKDEVSGLVTGSVDGAVSCWSNAGVLNWRFLTMPGNWIWSARAWDVNDDQHSELILGTKGRRVLILDRSGNLLDSHTFPQGIRSVFVAGQKLNSSIEYLLGCEDASLYVLRSDGTIKWKYPVDGWIRSVIAADLDNDHHKEIICGSRGGVAYELDYDGTLRWKFDAGNWIRVVYACDLDKDGNLELVLGCDNGKIIVFGNNHQVIWTFDIGFRIEAIRMIELDGKRQLLVGSESQILYSLAATGEVAWKFDTMGWVRDIEIVDLDQDGCMELVLSTFSVVRSIQKSNYYLQVWKILDQEKRVLLKSFARDSLL